MICLPWQVGILTDGGNCFSTGSFGCISPRSIMSCSTRRRKVALPDSIENRMHHGAAEQLPLEAASEERQILPPIAPAEVTVEQVHPSVIAAIKAQWV